MRDARWYDVFDASGEFITNLSAGMVLSWHFDQLRTAREATVFAPDVAEPFSRASRQSWLRRALRSALHPEETSTLAMIESVTPHSFRPGLAGDLLTEGVPLARIAVECRWQGTRIVRMYAERMPLIAARSARGFRRIAW